MIEDNMCGPEELENLQQQAENSQVIKILVYPPKNKKFRVDEATKSIQIEPLVDDPLGGGEICQSRTENVTSPADVQTDGNLANDASMQDECMEKGIIENEDRCACLAGNNVYVKEVLKLSSSFKNKNCFLKGCKWSPDGYCLLSNSEDNILRLFEIPEITSNLNSQNVSPVLTAKEGGTIYDYEWYPKMNSSDPVSCVFASTSQYSPIHLWDAFTGLLRATYQPINQYDEVTAAYSLAFSPDGSKIYSGFKKCLRIFDVAIPGRISEERNLKMKGNPVYQTNIISCISVNPIHSKLYAVGSYDRSVGIYTEPDGELQCLLNGHRGGITQVTFSSDGIRLYSGARMDPEIICWDLRNPGKILLTFNRCVTTNQRIYFDLSRDGSHLVTGSTDQRIIIYDMRSSVRTAEDGAEPLIEWKGHGDCVNGVQFHPFRSVLSSASGQYHIPDCGDCDDGEDSIRHFDNVDNSIKIWSIDFNDDGNP